MLYTSIQHVNNENNFHIDHEITHPPTPH